MREKARLLLIVISLVLLLCSCQKKEISNNSEALEQRYFDSYVVSLPDAETIKLMDYMDGKYWIISSHKTDEIVTKGLNSYYKSEYQIQHVDMDGNLVLDGVLTDIDNIVNYKMLNNNQVVFITPEDIRIVDLGNNMKSTVVNIGGEFDNSAIERLENSFVVVTREYLIEVDFDGNILNNLAMNNILDNLIEWSIFMQNRTIYMSTNNYSSVDYYLVEFSSGRLEKQYSVNSSDMAVNDFDSNLRYIVKDNGDIYKVDVLSKTVEAIVLGENTLLPPTENKIIVYDDDSFISLIDENSIAIARLNPNLNLDNREEIICGGTGLMNYRLLKMAAYKYNVSQNEYLITFKEFEVNGSISEELSKEQIELLNSLVVDGMPDLIYGSFFNYEYMYNSGLIIDLSDDISRTSNVGQHIKRVLSGENSYILFPGYGLFGYYGLKQNDTDGSSGRYGNTLSYKLAQDIICSNLDYRNSCSEDEILKILEYSFKYGDNPFANNEFLSEEDIRSGNVMFINNMFLEDFNDYKYLSDITYAGIPYNGKTTYMMLPYGKVAISSDTRYKKQLMEFLDIYLSDDIQTLVIDNGLFPVNDKLFEEYIEELKTSNPSIGEDVFDSYRDNYYKVEKLHLADYQLLDLIKQEMNSYYLEDKPISVIARNLTSEINLYLKENYSVLQTTWKEE